MKSNYGFKPPTKEELEQSHKAGYVLGGLSQEPIQPDGQWDDYLPSYEIQHTDAYDTYNCTAYGSTNLVEIFLKRLFGIDKNYSERYLGIMAGTRPPGNSPHKVLDQIRASGLIDDILLPLSEAKTIEEYYSPDPIPYSLKEQGRAWVRSYEMKHEWVLTPNDSDKPERIKRALAFSPVGVSVYAWRNKDGLYYKPSGARDNHWCLIYGYKEGEYWKVFDSYDATHKRLTWNYDFDYAKRIRIAKRKLTPWQEFWKNIALWITRLLGM